MDAAADTIARCKVCEGEASLFDVVDFGRQCDFGIYPDGLSGVPVYYHRCGRCGLIFTKFFDSFDSALWREKVYNEDYARIDPDYAGSRAAKNAKLTAAASKHLPFVHGCDFGGGSGGLADHMRRRGMDFISYDLFGKEDATPELSSYSIITAFEVMEHSATPLRTFSKMTGLLADGPAMILFSTATCDHVKGLGTLGAWWYAAPRNGHCTLYSTRSLQLLAEHSDLTYRRVTASLHLLGRDVGLGAVGRDLVFAKILSKVVG